VADLILVRPVSASEDPRFGIWNVFHDGDITIMQREASNVVIMFVCIPYLRRRIQPLGDSFRLRLGGFRSMRFENGIGDSSTELSYVEGYEILSTESHTMPVNINLAEGTLNLDFESLEISLDTGQSISYEEVCQACEDYWDEWEKKAKQV
jgi:hypothetical protein